MESFFVYVRNGLVLTTAWHINLIKIYKLYLAGLNGRAV
jgi:hypothetical protein